ncbi:MAG: hypothetical protein IJA31_06500 [Clostridia bacterium]|nr:hypothetical protein [Clostridia bacterium]
MKKVYKYLSSFVFLALVFVLLLLFIVMPKTEYSSNEKRVLSEFPAVTFDTVADGSFGSKFETYLSDHFPFRNFFVGLNAYYSQLLGNNGATGIYNAKDGYLISKPEAFNPDRLTKNLGYISDFAEKNALNAVLLAVPSPGSMLEDKLPKVHEEYADSKAFALIEENLTDSVQFTDMRDIFASSDEQIYYRTDHHITSAGSYLCYEALCNALLLPPVDRSAFHVETSEGFYGTTYSRSGLWLEKPDTVELWKDDSLDVTVWVSEDGSENEPHDGIFFTDHLTEDDQYPVFLDGNHGYTHIHNENADGGKLLIVKDSYAHCMTGFLASHYSDIYMIDLRYYKLELSPLVAEKGIDTVLYIYGIDNLSSDSNIAWLA